MRFLLLLAALIGASPLPAQTAPRIPVEDFAAPPALSSPTLSPDGFKVAATATVKGMNKLVIIDLAKSGPPTAFEFDQTPISDIEWAGSNRLLVTAVGKGKFLNLVVPMMRLMVIDLATGQSRIADGNSRGIYGGDVLYADPSGNWAIVSSQSSVFDTPSVKRVDLNTGTAEVIEKARPNVWEWFADEAGVVRGGIAYDEKRWKLWYRDRPGEPLRALKGSFDQSNNSAVDRVIFGHGQSQGAVITNERTGRFGAYAYDFVTGAIGSPIFEHPRVDIGEVWIDQQTGAIAGVRYQDDRWRTHWLDPKFKALQAKLDRSLPGKQSDVIGKSRDGNMMLIWSGSASDPGTYFVLDRASSRMRPVFQPFDKIDPARLADVQSISYPARDGLAIAAYMTLPKGAEQRNLPLILLPHGGPFIRDEWSYDPVVQFLANRGYAVLQPQFRGSTGYGKDFVTRGYGEWGRKMQDDLDDGVDALVKRGIADPRRVCIVGGSYGGYAALWGAIRNPERYRCAVSIAGVTDLDMQLKSNRKSFSAVRYFRQWRTKVQGEGKFDLRTVSPLAHAARLRVPVLIAHGETDETVPVKQGHAMVDALRKAGADITYVFYKEGGHGFSDSADFADFLRRLEAFLAKHNPTGSTAR